MDIISWATSPDKASFWHIISYIVNISVAVGVLGESISNEIVPDKWIPRGIRSSVRLKKIAHWSTWLLIIALFVEINSHAANSNIDETIMGHATKHVTELVEYNTTRLKVGAPLLKIAASMQPYKGTRFDISLIPGDPEAAVLMLSVALYLKAAGLEWVSFDSPNASSGQILYFPGSPHAGTIGAGVWIYIQVDQDHRDEYRNASETLSSALSEIDGVPITVSDAQTPFPNHDRIHIIIGKKRFLPVQ